MTRLERLVEDMLLFSERFIHERFIRERSNQRGPIGVHPSSGLTARAGWTAATTMEGLRSGA
jgi:hypothetical protein